MRLDNTVKKDSLAGQAWLLKKTLNEKINNLSEQLVNNAIDEFIEYFKSQFFKITKQKSMFRRPKVMIAGKGNFKLLIKSVQFSNSHSDYSYKLMIEKIPERDIIYNIVIKRPIVKLSRHPDEIIRLENDIETLKQTIEQLKISDLKYYFVDELPIHETFSTYDPKSFNSFTDVLVRLFPISA